MDAIIRKVSSFVGVPDDLLRIAVCIVGSFPLGSFVKRIPLKHTFLKESAITGLGIFYLAGIFNLVRGSGLIVLLSLLTYTLAALFPSKYWMPWANFILQMGLMLVTHCYEQFGGGDFVNEIGISGTQMIIVQKLTCYAWDVYDGTQKTEKLNDHQKLVRLTKIPSVSRFFSWIFFFPTILTGPSCTFAEYEQWFDLSLFKDFPNRDPHTLPRSGFLVLGVKLLEGLFWVSLYTQSTSLSWDHEFMYKDWFVKNTPFWGRVGYLYLVGLSFRTKYYAAWTLTEAACIHCGLGYNGVNPQNGRLRWDRMRNVKPMSVESGQNFRGVFGNWNIITSKWLRHYVYERVTPPNKKPGVRSTFATFLVSALWHGTRPGYYLTFVTGAVYQTFGKLYRHHLRPVFVGSRLKKSYDAFTWFVTQLALSYGVLPFIVLNLKPAFWGWYSVYFFIYVGLFVSWLLLQGPLRPLVVPKLRMMHRDIKKAE